MPLQGVVGGVKVTTGHDMGNKIYDVEKIVAGGDGIVRDGELTIFVPYVLPGERVKIEILPGRVKPARAAVTELVEAASDRVKPRCPHFGKCGGCQLQHVDYGQQLRLKEKILEETIDRIAKIKIPLQKMIPSPQHYNYRSRVRLHVRFGDIGFFTRRKDEFIPLNYCHLTRDGINDTMPSIEALVSTPEVLSVEIIEGKNLTAVVETGRSMKTFILEGENESGEWVEAPGLKRIFAQVNPAQNMNLQKLVSKTVAQLKPEGVIELYAGSGNLTEAMQSRCGWIEASDVDAAAVKAAKKIFGPHVKFKRLRADRHLREAVKRKLKPGMIVLDPPRSGAKEAVAGIIKLRPGHILYVSCDPATFARDLKEFVEAGYKIEWIKPIDMFPQTAHIEAVCLLSK